MKTIHLENQTVFLHKYNSVTFTMAIPLNKEEYLTISYNPNSSLYNEENYEEKTPLKPFDWTVWYVSKYYITAKGQQATGIGLLGPKSI